MLDEAEAEAVLLALGATLHWELPDSDGDEYAEAGNGGKFSWYKVGPYGPDGWEASHLDAETTARLFSTRMEAKAACERHHATGKWE